MSHHRRRACNAAAALVNESHAVANTGSDFTASAASSFTLSDANLGGDALNRFIIVALNYQCNNDEASSFSSITVGGVSATVQIDRSNGTTPKTIDIIATLDISGIGSTADIVANFNESVTNVTLAYISVYDLADITADASDEGAQTSNTSRNCVLSQASNAFAAVLFSTTDARTQSVDSDFTAAVVNNSYAQFSYQINAASGSTTYTSSWTGASGCVYTGISLNRAA